MKRNQERRRMNTDCPKIHDELEKTKLTLGKCDVHFARELKFEIDCKQQSFKVDLESKTCGCRKWDLTRVPCLHVGSIINFVLISNIYLVWDRLFANNFTYHE